MGHDLESVEKRPQIAGFVVTGDDDGEVRDQGFSKPKKASR